MGEDRMTYRERRERRADRRRDWGDSRERKQAGEHATIDGIMATIPLGQPILVGHHSERGHRRDLARIEKAITRSVEHGDKKREHQQAADTIEQQLATSIYDDDVDAIERLEAKIADLEAQRERIKGLNRRIRKGERLDTLGLTDKETKDLWYMAQYHNRRTFAPYVLQNLGGNITRAKQRLARLRAAADEAAA